MHRAITLNVFAMVLGIVLYIWSSRKKNKLIRSIGILVITLSIIFLIVTVMYAPPHTSVDTPTGSAGPNPVSQTNE